MKQYRLLTDDEPRQEGDEAFDYATGWMSASINNPSTRPTRRPLETWVKFSDRKPDIFPCVVFWILKEGDTGLQAYSTKPCEKWIEQDGLKFVAWLPFAAPEPPKDEAEEAFVAWCNEREPILDSTDPRLRKAWNAALEYAKKGQS